MSDLYKNIKRRRISLGLSQLELAKKMGYTSSSTISKIESGENDIPQSKIKAFSDALDTTPSELMGWEESNQVPEGFEPPPEMVLKPLVGSIACGTPILAEQNINDYINVPKNIKCDFTLTCKGDSMIDSGIMSGDVVYLVKQPDIDYNGQIAAVRIDNEATLKKVFKYSDKVVLQPSNANYEPLIYIKEEINNLVIEGVATGFTHKFNH